MCNIPVAICNLPVIYVYPTDCQSHLMAVWEMTDMFHLKAIEIIARSLRSAVANEKEGREGMALGEYIAGMGFSNVGLGIAHSMAHTLGAVYDTPHGVACAMMLPIVMEYNADCTGEKYREIARAIGIIIANPEFEDVRSLEGVAPTKKPCVPIIAVPCTKALLKNLNISGWSNFSLRLLLKMMSRTI
jgi:alcohol dehydrogenase class IV